MADPARDGEPATQSRPSAASTAFTRGRSACCARLISTAPTRSAKCGCSTSSRKTDHLTASDIARALDLDAGYLSRLLRNFEKRGLISRKTSAKDGRQSHLALTARGRKLFAPMEERSQQHAGAMLDKLDDTQQAQIVAAMNAIETLLAGAPAAKTDAKSRIRSA